MKKILTIDEKEFQYFKANSKPWTAYKNNSNCNESLIRSNMYKNGEVMPLGTKKKISNFDGCLCD